MNILAGYCTTYRNNSDEMKLLQSGMFIIFAIVSGESIKLNAFSGLLDRNKYSYGFNLLRKHFTVLNMKIVKVIKFHLLLIYSSLNAS